MPRKSNLKIVDQPSDVEIIWRKGAHPPKNVEAAVVKAALDELDEPSPDQLLEASKRETHCLHAELWSEGDQIWAQRGRLERCRHIIADLAEIVIIGGREIEIRAVEWLRDTGEDGESRWATIQDIMSDRDLLDSYLAEVGRLQEQASAKLAKVRELMKS